MKKLIYLINILIYRLCCMLPLNENSIVFESEGLNGDNAYSLYLYLKSNNFLDKYKITWLIDESNLLPDIGDSARIKKDIYKFDLRRSFLLATSKYFIYDHFSVFDWKRYKKRKKHKIIFLTHGCGFKAATSSSKCLADEIYVTGKLYSYPVSMWCNCDIKKIIDLGYPRLDCFFQEINTNQRKLMKHLNFDSFKKVFLWMPTFRRSSCKSIDEDYFSSETGLPILYDEESLVTFDDFLKKENALCIFKVHHLQASLNFLKKRYQNIYILKDEDIQKYNVLLYQFVMLTDCLITDYSSISTDYMLLDRPIIYTMDDYEDYRNSRGFSIENPHNYFVGLHAYDEEQLFKCMKECIENIDFYKEERKKTLPLMHTHNDGNSSARILNHLGITLEK